MVNKIVKKILIFGCIFLTSSNLYAVDLQMIVSRSTVGATESSTDHSATGVTWRSIRDSSSHANTVIPGCEVSGSCVFGIIYRVTYPNGKEMIYGMGDGTIKDGAAQPGFNRMIVTLKGNNVTWGGAANQWIQAKGAVGLAVMLTYPQLDPTLIRSPYMCFAVTGPAGTMYPSSASCNNSTVTPTPVSCKILSGTGDTVNIDHGTLSASNLNNATATAYFQVTCNQNTSMRFSTPDPVIRLGTGLTSTISLSRYGNSVAWESSQNITPNIGRFDVKSTLTAAPSVSAGTYTGSMVIIISLI